MIFKGLIPNLTVVNIQKNPTRFFHCVILRFGANPSWPVAEESGQRGHLVQNKKGRPRHLRHPIFFVVDFEETPTNQSNQTSRSTFRGVHPKLIAPGRPRGSSKEVLCGINGPRYLSRLALCEESALRKVPFHVAIRAGDLRDSGSGMMWEVFFMAYGR